MRKPEDLRGGRSPTGRRNTFVTKVGSGKQMFLEEVDGRSLYARRYRELYFAFVEDAGGVDHASMAQHQLARRAAALSVEAEIMEAKQATGERLDLDTYTKATNALKRVLDTLGVKREPRDVTPTLQSYLTHGEEP